MRVSIRSRDNFSFLGRCPTCTMSPLTRVSVWQLSVLTGVRFLQTSLENMVRQGDPDSESDGWLLENSFMETARINLNIIKNLGKSNQIDTATNGDPNINVPSSSTANYGPDNVPPKPAPDASWHAAGLSGLHHRLRPGSEPSLKHMDEFVPQQTKKFTPNVLMIHKGSQLKSDALQSICTVTHCLHQNVFSLPFVAAKGVQSFTPHSGSLATKVFYREWMVVMRTSTFPRQIRYKQTPFWRGGNVGLVTSTVALVTSPNYLEFQSKTFNPSAQNIWNDCDDSY